MPPGNTRAKPPAKVIERITAETCLELALSVQRSKQLEGDEAGSDAASQVAKLILEEVLREAPVKPRVYLRPESGNLQKMGASRR